MSNETACKYGDKCYRKNPDHVKKFHSSKPDESGKRLQEDMNTEEPPRKYAKIFEKANKIVPKDEAKPEGGTSTKIDNDTVRKEEENAKSSENLKESLKSKFLVDMPQDFYSFFKFCQKLNKDDPLNALISIGLKLVGPFDLVAGKLPENANQEKFLCHWRYFYDPPEFQTVLASTESEFHIGYYRDDPREFPVFVASMGHNSTKPHLLNPLAANIFDAVRAFCMSEKKENFSKIKIKIDEVMNEYKFEVGTKSEAIRVRRPLVVCRGYHEAGLVVPYDKKTDVGYREIPETYASLGRMMKKVSEAKNEDSKKMMFANIQELMTNAQWATDEGDTGMSLDLGLALFLHGCPYFDKAAQHLMSIPYSLMRRQQFATILQAHLKNRRKGFQLSSFKN